METTAPRNHPTLKQLMHSGGDGDGSGNGVSPRRKPLIHKHKQEEEEEEVKLAALAISFNMRLRSADMPLPMQERALRHARALLDAAAHRRRPNPTLLARSLKKEFDSVYGPAWHCVAGKSFGSFVTHTPGGFLYFSVDSLSFLLFKTEVHPISQTS
ncbi:probable dynein light chain [Salvia splendens]|uniref:probable dynein light chain n=1 Tax=Salvia splendens TaxID=180675 RepID=UPI001C261BAE|nr:probable dynein light chain [Salvia splendens]